MRRITGWVSWVLGAAAAVVIVLLGGELLVSARGSGQASAERDVERLLSTLGPGTTVEEFDRRIGRRGETEPNPSPWTATIHYGWDGFQVVVQARTTATTADGAMRIERIEMVRDRLTMAERKRRRDEAWSDWVRRHSPP